jgi:hypothetical protein
MLMMALSHTTEHPELDNNAVAGGSAHNNHHFHATLLAFFTASRGRPKVVGESKGCSSKVLPRHSSSASRTGVRRPKERQQ